MARCIDKFCSYNDEEYTHDESWNAQKHDGSSVAHSENDIHNAYKLAPACELGHGFTAYAVKGVLQRLL